MTITINGTTGIAGVDGSASVPAFQGNDSDTGIFYPAANTVAAAAGGSTVWNASSTFGFKNRIINGAMMIDQRNAGASVTPASGDYTLDRFQAFGSAASKYSVQRDTTAPAGFINSLKVTSLAATSVAAGDYYMIEHKIEGTNCADLAWGTASAKTVTLSFQVYSSLTGTFGGAILNSASNRSYPFTYTISSANTWTSVSVTIPGDTSGTWLTTTGVGLYISFSLGMGSTYSGTAGAWAGAQYWSATGATSVVGTNGATWYITGVQLEVGTVATSFDYRPYGTELALCQRYYEQSRNTSGASLNAALAYGIGGNNALAYFQNYLVEKRANATLTFGFTYSNGGFSRADSTNNGFCFQYISTNAGLVNVTIPNNTTAWTASAEL